MVDRDEMDVAELIELREKQAEYKRALKAQNPEYAERQREACRRSYRKRVADPEKRAAVLAAAKERKRIWRALLPKERALEERRKGAELKRKAREDDQRRAHINAIQAAYYNRKRLDPAWRAEQNAAARAKYTPHPRPIKPKPDPKIKRERKAQRLVNEPGYREKVNAAHNEYVKARRAKDSKFAEVLKGYSRADYERAMLDPEKLKRKRQQSSAAQKRWAEAGKAAANIKRRRDEDVGFKLRQGVSRTINTYMRRWNLPGGKIKSHGKTTLELIGYGIGALRLHLDSLLQPGMTWANYGRKAGQWSIDHTIPQSSFDFTNPEEIKKCWALSNLCPMWHIDNVRKSNKTDHGKSI
jgi:hypothetical protein